ncbi:DUF167 domain-containing protein [Candidatus Gracilibacteria bacterium]|nr:DUF167 domain-containing protein [Candidatus Gracilibacteria bacterium]
MKLNDYVKFCDGKTYIRIKVIPRQPKTEFVGVMEDNTYKIRLNAIPEKGKANKELICFLAKELEIGKEGIKIISGETDTIKLVRLSVYNKNI